MRDRRALRTPRHPHRPGLDQSLNGHLKAEYPHLLAIGDPATLRAELESPGHTPGVGYFTPHDEHKGRGEAIRKARDARHAWVRKLAWHRDNRQTPPTRDSDDVG